MTSVISLLIVLISLSFFMLGIFLSSSFYFKKHDVKYSFVRMFPYEYNYPNSFRNNVYGNVAFIVSLVGMIVFYIYSSTVVNKADVTLIVLSVAAVALSGFIACLFFMPLQFLRTHMILSTLAMVFAFAVPALECCYIYPYFKNMVGDEKIIYLVAFIVGVVIALTMLIFLFNPKATYKIYLDKSVDKDGNEVFARPKFIAMAFNEWWSIFNLFISSLPLIIISFIK